MLAELATATNLDGAHLTPRNRLLVVLSSVFEAHGGIPRFNRTLCAALGDVCDELDLEATVISLLDSVEVCREHDARGSNVRFVAGGGMARTAARVVGHCANTPTDLLLLGTLGMTPLGVACRPFLRCGFGFVAHGLECWHESSHPAVESRWSRRASAAQARFALSVSEYTARQLSGMTGLTPARVRLLPNSLAPEFERMLPTDEASDADGTVELLTVARLWADEKLKGVDHTLRAFARLAPNRPGLRYRIVGDGTDKARLVRLAESLGVHDRVVFENDLSDTELADRYRRCNVFVLPSAQEGFGIVYLEAMRFAKACVAANVGGAAEVVEDGRTGVLVPFADVDALADAIASLADDRGRRSRMGRAGQQRLHEQYSFDRFRARLATHLQELLAR